MKHTLTGLLALVLLAIFLLFPAPALEAARDGLTLWCTQIVPALFPCMLLTQICIHSGLFDHLGKGTASPGRFSGLSGSGLYIAILGLLCGIPMGAKLTADFYRNGRIHRKEALYLLYFSSQLSPAFLLDVAWRSVFPDLLVCRLLFLSYYMSVLLLMLVVRSVFYLKNKRVVHADIKLTFALFTKNRRSQIKEPDHRPHISCVQQQKEASQTFSLSENLDTSIMNSIETILRIGGYVILFSILAGGYHDLSVLPARADCVLSCILEITTGLQQLTDCSFLFFYKAVLLNTLCAFGGLSSLMQAVGMLKNSGLSPSVCCLAKLLQALLTAGCTALLFTVWY